MSCVFGDIFFVGHCCCSSHMGFLRSYPRVFTPPVAAQCSVEADNRPGIAITFALKVSEKLRIVESPRSVSSTVQIVGDSHCRTEESASFHAPFEVIS